MGRPSEKTFIYGVHPLMEALNAGKEIEKVLLARDFKNPDAPELLDLLKLHQVPIQKVPKEKLYSYTLKNHQGVIAFPSPITYQPLDQVLPNIYDKGEEPFFLLLDRITDVGNFGAIVRSAECSGVHGIIIPARGSALINSHAVKSSAGAIYQIPICREMNLKDTLRYLKDYGLKVVACTEKTDHLCSQSNLTSPTVVVMGSEETGISEEYLKLADEKVKIPMYGEIGSYNVSVATGIILYEVQRQRNK